MTRAPLRAPALTALLAALCVSLPVTAGATTLVIQFTGLDLVYDGSQLCDAVNCSDVRAGDPADADPLTTMTLGFDFDDDGIIDAPVEIVTANIWADIELDLASIPVDGGMVSGGAGYFDLLTEDAVPGYGIGLTIEEWTATYLPNNPDGPFFFFGSGMVSSIIGQDLPVEFLAQLPIEFSFSSQVVSGLDDDGEFLNAFIASGTGEVTAVPEPGTAGLLGLGLLGLAAAGSPRQRRAAR